MTELEIYNSLIYSLGVQHLDKDQARAALKYKIKQEPSWGCVLPESLLDKLNIKYDRIFLPGDVQLAAAIKGRLERRITL
jgi:hypothetical protein